jgi:DNA-binding beta-propeller fold protein YncE
MRSPTYSVFLWLSLFAMTSRAENPTDSSYYISHRIKGPDGQWDYAIVDAQSRRVYVARQYGVMVVDIASQSVLPLVMTGDDVRGISTVGDTGLLASANAGTHSVRFYRPADGAMVGEATVGQEPDAILFEPKTRLLVAVNHEGGDLSLIDVDKRTTVGQVRIGGKLEFAVADGAGLVYVNVENKNAIAVADIVRRKTLRLLPLAGCEQPTGLAYDDADRWVISVCFNGAVRVVDPQQGSEIAQAVAGRIPDAAIWDAKRRLIFVPSYQDGTLSVIHLSERGSAHVVQSLRTQVGTRTGALDPVTGRLYLPTSKLRPPPAPGGYPEPQPGTFEVLVIDSH